MATSTKESRIAVRVSNEQDALIRRAAEAEGVTVTEFTVQAALSHARDVLADRRLFVVQDPAWVEFTALLERPVVYKPDLAKLMAEGTIFE
jgi:uncharacterized protein (DUF1778 family)